MDWFKRAKKGIIAQKKKEFPNGFVTELFQYYVGKDLSKINFIGKQENAENDLVEALKLSGQEFDEGRLRRTKWIACVECG